jgi:steroid delta-isomerase-like uncharacterized protein
MTGNADLVDRYLRAAWADGTGDGLEALLSADFCDHDAPPGYGADRAEHLRLIADLAAGARDRQLRVLARVADADSVAVRLETTWTQQGDFFGIPADGRRLVLRSMDLYRIRGGRITDSWHCEDIAGVLRQLDGPRGDGTGGGQTERPAKAAARW